MTWRSALLMTAILFMLGFSVTLACHYRGELAKPIILSMDRQNNERDKREFGVDSHTPWYNRDGTITYWYEDSYTEPNTRCYGTLMNWGPTCIADERKGMGGVPCERAIIIGCDLLYPGEYLKKEGLWWRPLP